MANHKSALKRAKQSEVKRSINSGYKTHAKNVVKDVRAAIGEGSGDKAKESLKKAVSVLQKTASKGAIHRKKASRKISRLAAQINQLSPR
ncbi:MAG: 30S ribosomal protein S20 [Deltaproteobacteria bacterium]|nr:30S ribosomal protein S20 [Deltaproteobacteria bacterium]